mgnify:CR=1 FL=1
MLQIKFILRCKIPSLGATDEYQYMIEVVSNTGVKYQSYDVWHGYAQNAKEAKAQILFNISQTQAIDYVMDNVIIKDSGEIPYFIAMEPTKTKWDIMIRKWNTTINR